MNNDAVIFWHRRDLRWHDNTALAAALETESAVIPIFIFDTNILDLLEDKDDARITFIHRKIQHLNKFYKDKGGALHCFHGDPLTILKDLTTRFAITAVYTNEDYEPYARDRDKAVGEYLHSCSIAFETFQDHVIIHPGQVVKDNGDPYVVYTPFSKKWRMHQTETDNKTHPSGTYFTNFERLDTGQIPTLESMGFLTSSREIPGDQVSDQVLAEYEHNRNFPGKAGTSRLGIHLRFGTISIRELLHQAIGMSDTFVNELIWREFYQMILWNFPRVAHENFHRKYDRIAWRNNEAEFERWCKGTTGYAIVDAGMNELNMTGFMHNRVRMVVASFLTKHLLIDWRWGEAYFARKLLDFELASNNGGWQWAAGTGTDAQPYFRIFNPYSQEDKFDKQRTYIHQWLPYSEAPAPIVEHAYARKRALEVYKTAVG